MQEIEKAAKEVVALYMQPLNEETKQSEHQQEKDVLELLEANLPGLLPAVNIPGFTETLHTMASIAAAKNADYTGGQGSFHNFELVENMGLTDTPTGILVRMADKMARITSLVHKEGGKVKDESVEDTLQDLANYAVILKCYLQHKRAPKVGPGEVVYIDKDGKPHNAGKPKEITVEMATDPALGEPYPQPDLGEIKKVRVGVDTAQMAEMVVKDLTRYNIPFVSVNQYADGLELEYDRSALNTLQATQLEGLLQHYTETWGFTLRKKDTQLVNPFKD